MSVDAHRLECCIAEGGVAVFPSDTVYGLACDPNNEAAVRRLYALKRRELGKPSAVMFFDLDAALSALTVIGERTRGALPKLLPGAVTVLLPNPGRRFPLACGEEPDVLGLRVSSVPALAGMRMPILQSSANQAGGADPRRVADVAPEIRSAVDLVIDGGDVPGTPSTVVQLRLYEEEGVWSVVRAGAVSEAELGDALGWQYHFDPDSYLEMIHEDIPAYDRLQDELVATSGAGAKRILELGTGTGETARRLLARHPDAHLIGIDVSEAMLAAARATLAQQAELRVGRLEDPLPAGPFDLVASVLCIHHLDAAQKADLFWRVRRVLSPGGRFAFADVVVPEDPGQARIELTPGYDKPSSVADQLKWLRRAGLRARVTWEHGDLAVIAADPEAAEPAGSPPAAAAGAAGIVAT